MVRSCALCGTKKNEKVALHVFPRKPELEAKWRKACGFVETDYVKTLVICSNHFKPEDYIQFTRSAGSPTNIVVIKKLKHNVVPSVDVPYNAENISPNTTDLSEIFIKKEDEGLSEEAFIPQEQMYVKIERDEILNEPSIAIVQTSPLDGDGYIQDFECAEIEEIGITNAEVATPERAERALFHARYIQNQLRRKIRKLHQDKRRLVKRMSRLEEFIKNLNPNVKIKKNGSVLVIV